MKTDFEQNKLEVMQELLTTRTELDLLKSSPTEQHQRSKILEYAAKEVDYLSDRFAKSIIFTITDEQGAILYTNHVFCSLFGYTERQLIGKNHRIFQSGYHSPEFYQSLWATIRHGGTWRGQVKDRSKYGHNLWLDTLISQFLNEPRPSRYYLTTRTDITAHKEVNKTLDMIPLYIGGRARNV